MAELLMSEQLFPARFSDGIFVRDILTDVPTEPCKIFAGILGPRSRARIEIHHCEIQRTRVGPYIFTIYVKIAITQLSIITSLKFCMWVHYWFCNVSAENEINLS